MELNVHNKQEYPPMHTAEHILNGTMVKRFGCKRAKSAHIERKKSKCDYDFPRPLSDEEIQQLEDTINEVIARDLPVSMEYVEQNEVAHLFDMDRLPDDASQTVRIVHIGDYDQCLCVGTHVTHTAEIGKFRISSTRYQDQTLRIVFRLDAPQQL